MGTHSGLIFVGESNAQMWLWDENSTLTKSRLAMEIGDDTAEITGDEAIFTVDLNTYNDVCDGKKPPQTPVGNGVLNGNSYTLWVQQNETKNGLIEDRLVIWPSKPRVNGLRRK